MKKFFLLLAAVILGGILLVPKVANSQERVKMFRSPSGGGSQGSSAACDPPCPKGEICKWKNGGGTVCGKPEIVINCPDNDPLCGADDESSGIVTQIKGFGFVRMAVPISGPAVITGGGTVASAHCDPPCPKGEICKWKNGGGTVCGKPEIVINCPDNDPLCGADD